MLAPDVRRVAVDLLRPPPGYRLDQAVLTTFSLDLEALLALPLAVLSHTDEGIDAILADPLLIIEGLREAGSRLHVFVDAQGIAIPRRGRELYSLLESSVHPVRAPNRGAFHPKVWVARFVDDAAQVCLRVAVLSRNLTFDRSWDVAITSQAAPANKQRSRPSRPLADLLGQLRSMTLEPIPEHVEAVLSDLADEVGRTRFPSPDGFEDPITFHAFGLGGRGRLWKPRTHGLQVLAVAPFLRRGPLDQLVRDIGGTHTLVSRADQLDDLPADALEGWDEVLVLTDAALDEVDDDGPTRLSGLHAKMLAIEHSHDVTWWLGSANLSDAAWRGTNVEVMAEVTGRKGRRNGTSGYGIDRFWEGGFRAMCETYRRTERPPEPASVAEARKALRAARDTLVDAPLDVHCAPIDQDWSWTLQGQAALPDGVVVTAWPVSVNPDQARSLTLPCRWTLPVARLTAFVAFRIEVPGGGVDAERFTRKLPIAGVPDDRANHVLRGLISSPERLLRFLRALLGGLEGLVDASDGDSSSSRGRWSEGLGGETLLEDLVRAASRDPKRLAPIKRVLDDLQATEGGQRIIPEGLLETWEAVEAALVGGRHETT